MAHSLEPYVAEWTRAEQLRHPRRRWLARTRAAALQRFRSLGFPTTREEEWRFTSVATDRPAHVYAADLAAASRRQR